MPPQLKPIGLHCSMKYETLFTATQKEINIILRDIPDSTLSALTQKQVIKTTLLSISHQLVLCFTSRQLPQNH